MDKDSIYNSHGSVNSSMGQPTTIEDKANDSISASKLVASQFKNPLQTSQDVEYFDNSTGGNNTITGKTASIKFTRSDDKTKSFLMQKRVGATNTQNNVFELYPVKPNLNAGNFIFIGVDGQQNFQYTSAIGLGANIDTTKTIVLDPTSGKISANNGAIQAYLTTDGVSSGNNLNIVDTRAIFNDSTKNGVAAILCSSGTNGFSGIGTTKITAGVTDLNLTVYVGPDGKPIIGDPAFKAIVYGTVFACPLPFTESALDKLPKDVEKQLLPGEGHYGDDIKYLNIIDAPDEMKSITPKGDKDIEITRTVGYLYSCIKELNQKIIDLETRLNN